MYYGFLGKGHTKIKKDSLFKDFQICKPPIFSFLRLSLNLMLTSYLVSLTYVRLSLNLRSSFYSLSSEELTRPKRGSKSQHRPASWNYLGFKIISRLTQFNGNCNYPLELNLATCWNFHKQCIKIQHRGKMTPALCHRLPLGLKDLLIHLHRHY